MPDTQTPDQKIAPKSVLRHRLIDEPSTSPGTRATPAVQRASRTSTRETNTSIPTWTRATTTQKASTPRVTARLTSPSPSTLEKEELAPRHLHRPQQRASQTPCGPFSQVHPLLLLGLGMLLMLLLWLPLSAIIGWTQVKLDDLRYGRPRTYQVDTFVGHNEQPGKPSHFIVINLNRHIDIIELQGGDATHTRIYTGPTLTGTQDDLTPATLRFVTPPDKKYPNMILLVGQSQILYLNENGTFVMQTT